MCHIGKLLYIKEQKNSNLPLDFSPPPPVLCSCLLFDDVLQNVSVYLFVVYLAVFPVAKTTYRQGLNRRECSTGGFKLLRDPMPVGYWSCRIKH
jgi:hypothetical protein